MVQHVVFIDILLDFTVEQRDEKRYPMVSTVESIRRVCALRTAIEVAN
jgi:hypothetical protein